jgi:hypothetical protein
MKYENEIKTLLQNALSVLCKSKRFEEDVMLKAQRLGLQGEKRRLCYESARNHNLINYFKRDSFDAYALTLAVPEVQVSNVTINGIQEFFQISLQKVEEQYDALHTIANSLVAANGQHYACLLYDRCRCLIEDVKYYRRTILEGNATGWKPEFIFLHQTTACNIHDEFEKKEAEVGYTY